MVRREEIPGPTSDKLIYPDANVRAGETKVNRSDVVVVSSAIRGYNPEVEAARARGVEIGTGGG